MSHPTVKDLSRRLSSLWPRAARAVLADCAAGEVSPPVALARLLLACGGLDPADGAVEAALARLGPAEAPALVEVQRLLGEHRDGAAAAAALLLAHPDPEAKSDSPDAAIARFRNFFDQAVARHEVVSVAAYSLGSAEILAAATAEIVALLGRWRLLGPGRSTLEIGCGIGRMQEALAPLVAEAHGTDVSPRMIEAARRRCAHLPNVAFTVSTGRDLAGYADATYDLVLAVDSFPYLHAAGPALIETHVREAARVLRPGGALAIMNFSYKDDLAADRAELEHLCGLVGFELEVSGQRPFELWDGDAFLCRLRR